MSLPMSRALLLSTTLAVIGWLAVSPLEAASDDPWPGLVTDVFDDRPMTATDSLISLEAPYRAEDAAIVPLTIRTSLPAGDSRTVKKITLVIDRNPSPVAAEFSFSPKAGVSELSTRVRVDSYTNIHAVAELSDGALYATTKYVKASGGCSAPAGKNPEEAEANLGRMKFRQFSVPAAMSGKREVQLMIRHPNNSGLQMDQVTRLNIPLRIVRDLKVWQGDDLLLRMEGGISISEDPNFRFRFDSNGAKTLRVEAVDTDEKTFQGQWPLEDKVEPGT